MATLRKKGNAYFIDYRLNGRRLRKNVGRSKKIAELALKDLEVKLARNELGFEKRDQQLAKLIEEYLSYCKTNLAPGTQKRYRSIIDNFKRFLSREYPHFERISHFSLKAFEDFKRFRKEEGAENSTINYEILTVRQMFGLAVDWGYAKENPASGVSRLKVAKRVAPNYLNEKQCKALLKACDDN